MQQALLLSQEEMAGGVARLPHGGCAGSQCSHKVPRLLALHWQRLASGKCQQRPFRCPSSPVQCPAFSVVNSGVFGCLRASGHRTQARHLQCNPRGEARVHATEAKPRHLAALRAPLALQRWVRRPAPPAPSPANDLPATQPSDQISQLPLQHQQQQQEQQQASSQGAATEGPFQSPVAAALAGVCALAVVVAVLWTGLAFKDDIKDLVVRARVGVVPRWALHAGGRWVP